MLLSLYALSVALAAQEPFWRSKENLYQRVRDGEVIVSVRDHGQRLVAGGGGHVQAPCSFVFNYAQNFERIARESTWVRSASYDAQQRQLQVTLAALSYEAKIKLQLEVDAQGRRITFRVIDGPMTGFTHTLSFVELRPSLCEVGISGEYRYDSLALPRSLVEFGLEVMLQKMATRLRAQVIAAFSASKETM